MKRATKGNSAVNSGSVKPPKIHGKPHGASNSVYVKLRYRNMQGMFDAVMGIVRDLGDVGGTVTTSISGRHTICELTINLTAIDQMKVLSRQLRALDGVEALEIIDRTFAMHDGGKVEIAAKRDLQTPDDLTMAYTPGVARVCMAIHADPPRAYDLTVKRNMIAVVTDGSRILALGNIGPQAGLPVMEGKAMLFKRFAGVDAFPLCLGTQNVDEIVSTIKNVAPVFGGINLEDIASPRCYEVERRLKQELDIPVFHDDQHATAVVVTAGTINAAKVVKKKLGSLKVVVCGVGAAGMGCAKMLIAAGVRNLIGFNSKGAIYRGRPAMTLQEEWLANNSNPDGFQGSLKDALAGADMFLGLSVANVLEPNDLKVMARDPIVFALANPTPEVDPDGAAQLVRVMATGRSDYPNAINNVLVFPGMFRGALDWRVREITDEMKMEAAKALAAVIPASELAPDYIIPSVFNDKVVPAIAAAVGRVARRRKLARIKKRR